MPLSKRQMASSECPKVFSESSRIANSRTLSCNRPDGSASLGSLLRPSLLDEIRRMRLRGYPEEAIGVDEAYIGAFESDVPSAVYEQLTGIRTETNVRKTQPCTAATTALVHEDISDSNATNVRFIDPNRFFWVAAEAMGGEFSSSKLGRKQRTKRAERPPITAQRPGIGNSG